MRWFGVRLQLLLTALIVLLAAAASAPSHYFCKMTGRAVAECCCASEFGPKAHRRTARAEAPDCCELRSASQPPVVVVHNAAVPDFSVASLAVTLPVLVYPEPAFRLLAATRSAARAPPAIGPPLFISHCALLI